MITLDLRAACCAPHVCILCSGMFDEFGHNGRVEDVEQDSGRGRPSSWKRCSHRQGSLFLSTLQKPSSGWNQQVCSRSRQTHGFKRTDVSHTMSTSSLADPKNRRPGSRFLNTPSQLIQAQIGEAIVFFASLLLLTHLIAGATLSQTRPPHGFGNSWLCKRPFGKTDRTSHRKRERMRWWPFRKHAIISTPNH